MRILTRYVLAEFLKVFLVTLCSLTFLILIVLLAKEALDMGLGLPQVVQIIPFMLPNALLFTVPGTTLFAACLVYGRLSSANEVLAVKAMGLSPMKLMWPCVCLSFFLSLATVWLNDVAWSWGYHGVQRVVLEAGEEIAYSMLRMHRNYSTKNFSINVKDVRDRRLIQATITFNGDEQGTTTITAEEAELRSNLRNDTLTIACRNFTMDIDGKVSASNPGVFEREVSLKEFRQKDGAVTPSRMSLARIRQQRLEVEERVSQLKREQLVHASNQLLTGNVEGLLSAEWQTLQSALQGDTYHLLRLHMEPFRRWANGFSCLCFLLVGAPIAVRMRNSDVMTSFIACFAPILVAYYPLLMFGIEQAKSGDSPPMIVWVGNVILALAGCWQIRKVIRY